MWYFKLVAILILSASCHCQNVDRVLVQFQMGPFISCDSWTPQREASVKQFMQNSLITEINSRCSCGFNSSKLVPVDHPICNRDYPNYPTYRTYVLSHKQFTATRLAHYIEDWVLQTSAVSDGLGYFTVDASCPVYPSSRVAELCGDSTAKSYSVAVLVGALLAELVTLLVVFFIVMAIVLSVYSNRLKRRNYMLKIQQKKRKRLNSSISHESSCPPRSESSRIDMEMKMQSCSAYATSI